MTTMEPDPQPVEPDHFTARRHCNVQAFLEYAFPFLRSNFFTSDVILRVSGRHKAPDSAEEDNYYVTVTQAEGEAGPDAAVLAAMWTPPHQVVIGGEMAAAAAALGVWFRDKQCRPTLTGVMGTEIVASEFARGFLCENKDVSGRPMVRMRSQVMQCTRKGLARAVGRQGANLEPAEYSNANERDRLLLQQFLDGFIADAGLPEREKAAWDWSEPKFESHFLVVDGEVVSWVCSSLTTEATSWFKSVGPVYTPPEHRCKGYATTGVHLLTKRLLEDANLEFVSLHVDSANPVSNRVYEKVGFRSVFDLVWLEW